MNIEAAEILRYTHDVIYWKDEHLVYLGCNNHAALLAGLSSSEEIIGKTDYDLPWREQATAFQKDDSEVIQNGLPKLNIQEQLLTAQGNIKTFISNKIPLKDEHGKTIGILGLSTEVTQLKNVQQQLQSQLIQKNNFLSLLVNQLPCHVFWKNKMGVYLGCNDAFAQSLGFSSANDILGKTDYDLPTNEGAASYLKDDQLVMESRQPKINIEEEQVFLDGTKQSILTSKVPLYENNDVVGVLGVYSNITELKKAQQQLQLALAQLQMMLTQKNDFFLFLLNQLPCYVFWKNRSGVFLGCNNAFAQLLGFNTADDVIGKMDHDLPITHESAVAYQEDDRLVMESRQPKINIEEEQVFLDGTKQWILTSKVPLYENNDVVGVLGVYSNITELKKVQEQLQVALAEIEEKNKIKTKQALIDCALQVSHDIRSPLAALNTALRYMPTLPEDQRVAIRHAVNRINDIANNLLIEYRDEKSGTPDSDTMSDSNESRKLRPELLSDILDALLSEKKMSLGNRRIELDLEIADSAFGVFVQVDAAKVKRMLSNIVNNAMEAMDDTGRITLRMQRGDANDHEVQLEIVDNGKGIPAAVLSQIQQAGGTHGKVGGTGIGVASAMALLREYGGSFHLDSQEGVGTTVSIQLPIVGTPSWFQSSLNLRPGMTVVVLDDDESIHGIWTTRCHAFLSDIHLEHVYSSDAFREYIASRPAEGDYLHLMDYELLGSAETGLDLIESLALSETAILVTSRYEEAPVRERTARLGVKMIPKNFSPYIPIVVAATHQPELVFLDDDETLTDTWQRAARFEDRFILTFNRTRELRAVLNTLQKNTPIYIDSNLHESISGQTFAKELYDLGFTELYLASGYPASYFGDLPWIKGFVAKEPPF